MFAKRDWYYLKPNLIDAKGERRRKARSRLINAPQEQNYTLANMPAKATRKVNFRSSQQFSKLSHRHVARRALREALI